MQINFTGQGVTLGNEHRNDPNGQPVGTTHNEAPDTFYDEDSWEPRDAVKVMLQE
ncbi:hypothetical protein [Paenibacillus donghaensis]|uniref:hypothetical protein n=1 Tax=Paenibacillus donghaensis TaxID=414771 RepID=UPI003CCB8BE9